MCSSIRLLVSRKYRLACSQEARRIRMSQSSLPQVACMDAIPSFHNPVLWTHRKVHSTNDDALATSPTVGEMGSCAGKGVGRFEASACRQCPHRPRIAHAPCRHTWQPRQGRSAIQERSAWLFSHHPSGHRLQGCWLSRSQLSRYGARSCGETDTCMESCFLGLFPSWAASQSPYSCRSLSCKSFSRKI